MALTPEKKEDFIKKIKEQIDQSFQPLETKLKELQKNLQILDSITGKLQSEKSSPEQHLPAFPSYQLQPHQNNNNTDFHGMAQSYRESPLL